MTTVPSERHASVTIDGKEKCSSDKRTEEDNGVITASLSLSSWSSCSMDVSICPLQRMAMDQEETNP